MLLLHLKIKEQMNFPKSAIQGMVLKIQSEHLADRDFGR
jgi:hypothetical protein